MGSNDHIPTEEIQQDIADTLAEISTMQREITAFDLLGDKMSRFKADARRDGIRERQAFIDKLNAILKERMPENNATQEKIDG